MRKYKSFFFLFSLLLIIPFFVSADDYSGPHCSEDPKDIALQILGPDRESVRGTCKEIETKTVVSIDPALQKDYFLGIHEPIFYGCDIGRCSYQTQYSEQLFLSGSSTLENYYVGVEENPLQYALFEKAYFVPLLSKMFKEQSLSFSESSMPEISISLFKKSELDEIKSKQYVIEKILPKNVRMDYLNKQLDWSYVKYKIYSFNYQEYGKYVYAPKGELIESQYAEFEKGENILNNNDLQIKEEDLGKGRSTMIISITNPLKSVTNYWIYTKKGGKLILSWQKSEYILDNGQTKIITGADKNISAALLFNNSFPTSSSKSIESESFTATTSVILPAEQKKGFFGRFLDLIISWFRSLLR